MTLPISHCPICQHAQAANDRRNHSCAQVLRAQVLALKSELAVKDAELRQASGALTLVHELLGKDEKSAVLAAIRMRSYATRMADAVQDTYDRATRTTVALALQLLRHGRSRRDIERSISALCMANTTP